MNQVYFLLVSMALLSLAACKGGGHGPNHPPVIRGILPAHGGYHSGITIRGINFNDAGTGTIVKINGITAPVVNATDTSLTVEVPSKAGDGKITVTIGEQTAESTDTFFYDYEVVVSNFAGNGNEGYRDGPGTIAQMVYPCGITIDGQDNLYVADGMNACIRKITPQGLVSTFLGNPGITGNIDGTGGAAFFGDIYDIKYDKTQDAFFIIDIYDNVSRIRKITPAGEVSTIAGGGADTSENVRNPLEAQLTDRHFDYITNLAVDANKNIYVTDPFNHYIRKINSSGIGTFVGQPGVGGYRNEDGAKALFWYPYCLTIANDNSLLVFDGENNRIRKITPSGQVSCFAGDGSAAIFDANQAMDASFLPIAWAMAQDSKGNVYIVNDGRLRMITAHGRVITLTGNDEDYPDGNSHRAKFGNPHGMVTDSHDNLFMADTYNSRIVKVLIQ